MSLLGGNGQFQDLLGQNASNILIEVDDLIVDDSLKLNYADSNKNVVTNADKELITEDKDSFVNTINIQWTQNNRAFTADTIQNITINSNPRFNNLQLDGKLTVEQGIDSNGDIDASGQIITCERLNASDKVFIGPPGGSPGGIFNPVFITPNSSPAITITTTNITNDTIVGATSGVQRGGLCDIKFTEADSMDIIFQIVALSGNNVWFGLASNDYTQADADAGTSPSTAQDNIFYISSNGNITGNFTGAPIGTGINVSAGDLVRILLLNGNILYYFDTGSGFGTPYAVNNIDPNTYRLFIWDGNTNNSNFEVVVNGTITLRATPFTEKNLTVNGESIFYDEICIDHLTADKNLVLDSNNVVQVEDRDTIIGTTNQIIVNQAGRDFTLSCPQDLDTNADFVVNTLNTGQGANQLYGMDQDVKTTSNVAFNEITSINNHILNYLNAYDVLYLDANKEIKGVILNDDQVLVGQTSSNPIPKTIGTLYELHQNQLGSKFDPQKTAPNITINEDGLVCIKTNDTSRGRILCINYFDMPRGIDGYVCRFGFEVLNLSGINLNIGFIPNTAPLQNSLYGDAGNYCYTSGGNIYENGTFITNIGVGYTTADIIEYEILVSNFYNIYKNGDLVYNSLSPIQTNQYYPQVFDQSTNLSTFKVRVYQTYQGVLKSKYITSDTQIDFSIGITKYLTFDNVALFPYTNLSYNLGKPGTNEWKNIYTDRVWAEVANIISTINNGQGSQTAPSYTFAQDNTTGFYLSLIGSPAQLSFALSGVRSYSWQQAYFIPERTSGTQDLGLTGRRWNVVYCNAVNTVSDERIKKDIVDIDVGLDELMKLKPKKYKFKSNDEEHYGLIAQEVQETKIKNVVSYDDSCDEYGMNYIELIPILIKSIQELKSEVDNLKSKLNI